MIDINLGDAIFTLCVLVGGALLLVTVLVDDLLGGILDSLHIPVDLGGASLMPLLLGFVSMFGVGGLFGTQALHLSTGLASIVGIGGGLIGMGVVYVMFGFFKRAEAPQAFSLMDLVGQLGRVSVGIPARRFGSVLLSYAGGTQQLTATADVDIPPGATVRVTGVAGSNLIVSPIEPSPG